MAADKSILQLLAASVLRLTDNGVVVQGTETERFEFQLLIDLLAANVSLGSTITSGTTVPTGGKDTDVYIKTNSGQVYQRIGGSWVVIYTFPSAGSGTTVIYGASAPVTATGNNGDTYIATLTGIFYQKTAGSWAQVYSMATGPQGPQGTAGTNGTNGVDGNTILYGNGNPSNGLGVNGNFYLNTANYTFFGPKASNTWPAGVSLINGAPTIPTAIVAGTTATPLPVTYNATLYPSPKYALIRADGSYDWNTRVTWVAGTFTVVGEPDGAGKFLDSFTFYILP